MHRDNMSVVNKYSITKALDNFVSFLKCVNSGVRVTATNQTICIGRSKGAPHMLGPDWSFVKKDLTWS